MNIDADALVALRRAFEQAPEVAKLQAEVAITESVKAVQAEVVEQFPRGQVGNTYMSFTTDVARLDGGVVGVVGSSAPVAAYVELGTKPHRPPWEPIALWAQNKLGLGEVEAKSLAFGIAGKIAKVGTPARTPLLNALQAMQPQIEVSFEAAAARLVAHLAGGGSGGSAGGLTGGAA